jgi:hypothetical protein
MAKVYGEAFFDTAKSKFFYRIGVTGADGQVLHESGAEFDTKEDAERELVALLRGIKKLSSTSTS